jgi:hypothetical protein
MGLRLYQSGLSTCPKTVRFRKESAISRQKTPHPLRITLGLPVPARRLDMLKGVIRTGDGDGRVGKKIVAVHPSSAEVVL